MPGSWLYFFVSWVVWFAWAWSQRTPPPPSSLNLPGTLSWKFDYIRRCNESQRKECITSCWLTLWFPVCVKKVQSLPAGCLAQSADNVLLTIRFWFLPFYNHRLWLAFWNKNNEPSYHDQPISYLKCCVCIAASAFISAPDTIIIAAKFVFLFLRHQCIRSFAAESLTALRRVRCLHVSSVKTQDKIRIRFLVQTPRCVRRSEIAAAPSRLRTLRLPVPVRGAGNRQVFSPTVAERDSRCSSFLYPSCL